MSYSHYDMQRLRNLPVEEVAGRLGLQVVRHKALCPFHEDRHPSLTFRRGHNTFRCFVCGAGGSGAIDLVMQYQGVGFAEALRWLTQAYSLHIEPDPTARSRAPQRLPSCRRQQEKLPPATADLPYLESLVATPTLIPEACRFLYDERHISPEVVSRMGLSSISRPVPMSRNPRDGWFNAPALLIPYRDVQGRLLSLQARYLGQERQRPRFQFPRGTACGIYHLPQLRRLSPQGDHLFITEGASDCWAMLSSGRKAIAIPSATLLRPDELSRLLALLPPTLQVHCCPDRDGPGERLYLELRTHLPGLVRHQLPEGYKDFGQWWAHHATTH